MQGVRVTRANGDEEQTPEEAREGSGQNDRGPCLHKPTMRDQYLQAPREAPPLSHADGVPSGQVFAIAPTVRAEVILLCAPLRPDCHWLSRRREARPVPQAEGRGDHGPAGDANQLSRKLIHARAGRRACGSDRWPGSSVRLMQPQLDPCASNPDAYRVLFENDRVRVLQYHDHPGHRTTVHAHPDSVMVTLSSPASARRGRAGSRRRADRR